MGGWPGIVKRYLYDMFAYFFAMEGGIITLASYSYDGCLPFPFLCFPFLIRTTPSHLPTISINVDSH